MNVCVRVQKTQSKFSTERGGEALCREISWVLGMSKPLNGVELQLPRAPGAPSGMLLLLFFASSSVIIAFVATRQLCRSAIQTKTPCGVRYVACHVQVVLLLSFLGPPWSQRCSDRCALGGSATVTFGCVCSSHVSGWLTSVEVFAAVSLGVSFFLSCWVG